MKVVIMPKRFCSEAKSEYSNLFDSFKITIKLGAMTLSVHKIVYNTL